MLNRGNDLAEVCRQLEIDESTWRWRKGQLSGMTANDATKRKVLEHGNHRLKEVGANLALGVYVLSEVTAGHL